MIYTNGPKTASYHKELKQFAFPPKRKRRHSISITKRLRASCLTSLYPIPIYCEGTLLPYKQLPCQKALLYSIALYPLSTARRAFTRARSYFPASFPKATKTGPRYPWSKPPRIGRRPNAFSCLIIAARRFCLPPRS